jgi:hypothetical protein
VSALGPRARLLLWDYDRGTIAYDLLCLALFAILTLVPAGAWGDPMVRP